MNAISLYVTTSRLVYQTEYGQNDQSWTDLYRLVPYLRQSLSCIVCSKLLNEPQKPSDGKCQHHVCKKCITGRKILKPSCIHCRDNFDFDCYEENIQMRILLQCYKYLCQYIMSTALYKANITNSGAALNGTDPSKANLLQFIEEGANFSDNFKANAGLTKSAYSILPCLFSPPITLNSPSPLSPSQLSQQSAQQPQQQAQQQQQQPIVVTSQQSSSVPLTHTPQLIQTQPQQNVSGNQAVIIQQPSSTHQVIQIQSSSNVAKKFIQNQIHKPQTIQHQQQQQIIHQPVPPPLTLVNNTVRVSSTVVGVNSNFKNNKTLVQHHQPSLNTTVKTLSNVNNIGNSKIISINQNQTQNNIINWPKNGVPIVTTSSAASVSNNNSNITISNDNIQRISTVTTSLSQPTVSIRNPPPIKTVSNGSAMYSVLYTGIGNKITIKRKTDNDDDTKKNIQYPPPRPTINKANAKRRGCRCGNATPTPGKLTCCGQRCPCYVDSKPCIDCKCRGCRNPHRPDGCKIRPVIPELACYEIQLADDSTNLSPNASLSSIVSSPSTSSGTSTNSFIQQQQKIHSTQKITSVIPQQSSKINTTNLNNCPMEIQLDDFITSNVASNSLGNIVLAANQITTSSSTPTSYTTFTTQPTFVVKKPQTITFTTNQVKRQQTQQHNQSQIQHQQQQTQNIQSQTIKLENTSTESLLIKSADGKFQVVNVYTSTPHSSSSTNFDRFTTTIPIQTSNLITTKHHIPEISTSLPQIIMQPQQSSNTTTTLFTSASSTNSNTLNHYNSSINNVTSFSNNGHHNMHQPLPQLITTTQQVSPTITLSPIIVSADQGFPSEIFSEEEIISTTTQSSASSSSPLSHPPPLHFSNHHSHLVEVVNAEDL